MEAIYLGIKRGVAKQSNEPFCLVFYAAAVPGVNGLEACRAFMPSDFTATFKPMQKINVEFGPRGSVVGIHAL